MSLPSALPNQIPPQNVPFCYKDANDQMIVDINWYLFLYNQWKQFSSARVSRVPLRLRPARMYPAW